MNFIDIITLILSFISGGLLTYLFYSKKLKTYLRQSLTDPVTGLYNYREFTKRFHQELARSQRNNNSFALLLIDIDDFKSLNSKYGYKNADVLMMQMLQIIKNELRQTDTLFRYRHGDEFSVIAINTNCKGAKIMAERIKNKVSDHSFSLKNTKVSLNISIGTSSFETHNVSMEDKAILSLKDAKQKV